MIPQKDWVRDLVIYQIYPRSFFDSNGDGVGDLPGVIQKLDYLQQLGVNALWLSPFFASPNDDNGYDVSDYRAILPEFGTMADCDELIRQCHARGMKFIMDLVVNHSSDEHEWFRRSARREEPYTDYYYWRDTVDGHAPNNWASVFGGSAWEYSEERGQYYFHLFSKKQPDLNWSCPALKQEIHDLIRWWKAKGVDGLRVDAISYLDKPADFPNAEGEPTPDGYVFPAPLLLGRPGTHAYLHELNEKLFTPLNLVTIGEVSLKEDAELADYVGTARGEFDMAIPFLPPIAEYHAHIPSMLRERLKSRCEIVPDGWWAQFMSNHDKPRQVSFFGNDGEYREISAKALALVNHVSPGTPFVYQGEELGMTSLRLDSIDQYNDIGTRNEYRQRILAGDTPEEALRFAADLSRDNARTPMQWSAAPNAGFTAGTPWLTVNPNYPEINAEAELADPLSVFHFYRRLIALRKAHSALKNGALRMIDAGHDDILAFARETDGETLVLAANLSDESHPAPEALRGAILLQSYERKPGFDGVTLRPWEAVLVRPESRIKGAITMNRIIPLWPGRAPYSDESPDQAQPSVKEFRVDGSRGAVVVCPGGGYTMKADHEGDPIARMLNEAGVSAYVLDYRVAPCNYLAPLTDALRAIRVVRSLGYEKVGILGFSAGGHLTCTAATLYTPGNPDAEDPVERLSSRPDVFLPCYPVVSVMQYAHVGSRVNLLGVHSDDLETLRRFSADQNVTSDTPPAFIWHTASDDCVPVENSLMLASALAAKGVPFELHVFPEGPHGLGLATELPDVARWAGLCQSWLIGQGFGL